MRDTLAFRTHTFSESITLPKGYFWVHRNRWKKFLWISANLGRLHHLLHCGKLTLVLNVCSSENEAKSVHGPDGSGHTAIRKHQASRTATAVVSAKKQADSPMPGHE